MAYFRSIAGRRGMSIPIWHLIMMRMGLGLGVRSRSILRLLCCRLLGGMQFAASILLVAGEVDSADGRWMLLIC